MRERGLDENMKIDMNRWKEYCERPYCPFCGRPLTGNWEDQIGG